MKIGLFGGTFNPVHRCHLVIAGQVRDRLQLDRVLFIPSGDPPHKPSGSVAPSHHRLEMVRLAIADEPSFAVSDLEVRRPTKSYSIETVTTLKTQWPGEELFFIVGLDAFLDLPTWRQARELLALCHFVVVSRPGRQFAAVSGLSLVPAVSHDDLAKLDAGRATQLTISMPHGPGVTLLQLPPCDASASDIRARLRTHRPLSKLLPASVQSYIIRSKLYQEETDRTGV